MTLRRFRTAASLAIPAAPRRRPPRLLAPRGGGAPSRPCARASPEAHAARATEKSPDPVLPHHFQPEEVTTTGSITAGGQRVAYHAVAGTLVVHGKGWDDVTQRVGPGAREAEGEDAKPIVKMTKAEASIFYTAYFIRTARPPPPAPWTFLYNGGRPGSATVWLHMGSSSARSASRDHRRPAPPRRPRTRW